MKGISVSKAAELVSGRLSGSGNTAAEILGVVIDSRRTETGFAFAALKGEKSDGHDYCAKAADMGAVCCIVEHEVAADVPQIVVRSTAEALTKLAAAYRKTLNIPVIGVAGSVGKTTAKEMVSDVLSQKFNVLKTEGNFNNELGVPLTVFRINPEHDIAVVEMGISDFGEMSRLASIVLPTAAVFTLIGHAHLERLHDREGVYKAKTEMLEFLPPDGTVFLNGDDDLLSACSWGGKKVFFGLGNSCDVRAENLKSESPSSQSCDIVCGDRRLHAEIPAYGSHMVYAALEGAAVGLSFGLSDEEIVRGIATFKTVGRRSSVVDTGYITLIDDCYNANPDSVKCAIDSLSVNSGRRVCILGDMLEMGEKCAERHAEIGRYVAESGAELLLCVGEKSKNTCRAAENIRSLHFSSNAELISELPRLIKKGDAVLVKASNSMHFDEIAEALKLLKE